MNIELYCDDWFADDEDIVVRGMSGFTPQYTTAASCVIRFVFEAGSLPCTGDYHVGFYCEGLSASDTFTVEAPCDDGW